MEKSPTERPKVTKVEVVVKSEVQHPPKYHTVITLMVEEEPTESNFNHFPTLDFPESESHNISGSKDFGSNFEGHFVIYTHMEFEMTDPNEDVVNVNFGGGDIDSDLIFEFEKQEL